MNFQPLKVVAFGIIAVGIGVSPSLRAANPVLPGFHADPEILYSNQDGRYYIYSTTDGYSGWGGSYYSVFSSDDLENFKDEGVAMELKYGAVPWADGNAWAPSAIELRQPDGSYRYYLYFSGNDPVSGSKKIGVAVSHTPVGPFKAMSEPLVSDSPTGRGQQIDVDVFQDPASGKYYLYWGNCYMAGAELNPDMTSIKPETITVMTPQGGTLADYNYREAPYAFYRDGRYYFTWSVDDTGSPNYHVAYGTADNPLGPITVAEEPVILSQRPEDGIYGTAHNAVIQLPGTDEWCIVYHRINPDYLTHEPGVHRQVCIDKMSFTPEGKIIPVIPTK